MHAHGRDVTSLLYTSAGHAVGTAVPNLRVATRYGELDLGGTPAADAKARAAAWRRLLAFLSKL